MIIISREEADAALRLAKTTGDVVTFTVNTEEEVDELVDVLCTRVEAETGKHWSDFIAIGSRLNEDGTTLVVLYWVETPGKSF